MLTMQDECLAPALDNCSWSIRSLDGSMIADSIRFQPDGTIAGNSAPPARRWHAAKDELLLLADDGSAAIRFAPAHRGADGLRRITGQGTGPDQRRYLLLEQAPWAENEVRRNLVVMRAGNNALFPSWPVSRFRNWDVAISYYGSGEPNWECEYFLPQKGPKWQPIYDWLTQNPHWLDRYDYFWFPDDDIRTNWNNVNDLFDTCRQFELQLAQPALTPDSYRFHEVTIERNECLLRFTVFVEGMVPVFRADALRRCLPVLQEESRFGWGHDWVFPKLLDYPQARIAIIDAHPVTHTRPAGLNTDLEVAERQKWEVIRKYGAKFMDHRVRGVILRQPLPGHFEQ